MTQTSNLGWSNVKMFTKDLLQDFSKPSTTQKEHIARLEAALSDLLDGMSPRDVEYVTGLPRGRVDEIFEIYEVIRRK